LNHQEPDKVPVDIGGTPMSSVHLTAYLRLRDHLGVTGGVVRVFDVMQQIVEIEDEVRTILGGDVVLLPKVRPVFGLSIENWKPYKVVDGTEALISSDYDPVTAPDGSLTILDSKRVPYATMPAGGYWFDQVGFPLAEASTIHDIASYDWESLLWSEHDIKLVGDWARRLHDDTNYAVVGSLEEYTFEAGQTLRGYSTFLSDLAADKKFAEALLDANQEVQLENVRRYLDAVGDSVEVVQVGDDLGTQEGPWMSLDTYRDIIKPRQARLYDLIRSKVDHLLLHSCGGIYMYIPDLIEIGVDVLNPVQTSARNMSPDRLKREFGRSLSFWGGGVDTQRFLPTATADEIYAHVRERINILAPGGGFVFCPEQNFQPEVPPEKIAAVYDAAKRFRTYPALGNA
jgi:uroporphyrinogen decarboxylase